MKDTKKRSLAKTISWRALVILLDMTVLFVITGSMVISSFAVISLNVIKTLTYYFHERFWERFKWGRLK